MSAVLFFFFFESSGASPTPVPGPLLVSSGFNLSDATSLTIRITRPDGSIFSVSGSVGIKNAYTLAGLYEAGTYATYQPVVGDITLVGRYQVELFYSGPTINPVLLKNSFLVLDLTTFATAPPSDPFGLVAFRNAVWF